MKPYLGIAALLFLTQIGLAQTNDVNSLQQEVARLTKVKNNFAMLDRYKSQNEALLASGKTADVVFFGNSITEMWYNLNPAFFTKNNFIGRGIGGQTTSQMLIRFRQDVVNLHPKKVVILCGINDIAQNTGPIAVKDIQNNIASMVDIARANRIEVVLCTILPSNYIRWNESIHPQEQIKEMNTWIKNYAKTNHLKFADYFSPMVDDQQGMKAVYTTDGVHCTAEGYKVMESIIQKALK